MYEHNKLFIFGDRRGKQLMPVGLAEVVFNTNVLQIDHFKVADDLQGKGYGREMYPWLENYGTFEHRAGVYLFADTDLHIKYVGKAGAVRMLAEIEDAIRRRKAYGARRVKALYTNSDERAISLETYLIDKYNPPNNFR